MVGGNGHTAQTYVLEKTVVDPTGGWMETESRNLEWTGILSVIERQRIVASGNVHPFDGSTIDQRNEQTTVCTKVTLESTIGRKELVSLKNNVHMEGEEPKTSFLISFSTARVQRTMESIGLKRAQDAVFKGEQGMNIVLKRLRRGGIACVLEEMGQDRESDPFLP